jgi:pimeloyl-ACP methyl ester carboxylesterase
MYVTRPGAKIFYQVTGTAERDLFLCPPCYPLVYGRVWKYQIPYLSRYFRVITKDFRGNGRSDRPLAGYDFATHYGDVLAVLDQAARPPIAFVSLSCGALLAIRYAVEFPERVSHLVLISPQYAQPLPSSFEEKVAAPMLNDFQGYLDRFWRSAFPEPHSLKGIEDGIAWGSESTPEILIEAIWELGRDNARHLLEQVRVPTLVVHGTRDRIVPYKVGREIAAAIPGARLVTFEEGGTV